MERRTDGNRKDLPAGDRGLQAGLEIGCLEGALLEELLEEVFVGLGDRLDEARARLRGVGRELGRDRHFLSLAAAVALEAVSLEPDEVDHADEVLLGADRQLHRQDLATEGLLEAFETASEVRPVTIHLVEMQNDRQLELGRGFPDLLGVDLGAGDGAHADDRGVGDAQRRPGLREEDAVAG